MAAKDAYLAALTGSLSSGLIGFGVAAIVSFRQACQAVLVCRFSFRLPAAAGGDGGSRANEEKVTEDEGEKIVAAPAAKAQRCGQMPIRVGNWLTRH